MADFEIPTTRGAYRLPTNVGDTVCFGCVDAEIGAHAAIRTAPSSSSCQSGASPGSTLVFWSVAKNYVCRKCGCNMVAAFRLRHAVPQTPPSATFEMLSVWVAIMGTVVAYYEVASAGGFDEWLAKWPEQKQRDIRRSIDEDPVRAGRVKAMVKREGDSDFPKRPRLIQFYPNLATQARYGAVFYALQKAFCVVFRNQPVGPYCDVTFASGLSPQDLGLWMDGCVSRGVVSFYERDGKSWDGTMQSLHSDFRTHLYGILDPQLAAFARACVKVAGFGVSKEGLFRYLVDGTVKSGHNDTTLGNSIVNAAIAVEVFSRMRIPCSIIVAGDDLLLAAYSDFNLSEAVEGEKAFGIVPAARKFSSPDDTSFISGIFFADGVRYVFLPKPGRLLARLFWSTKPPRKSKSKEYLRGIARGLWPVCWAIPVVRVLLRKADSPGSAVMSPGLGWQYSSAFVDWGCGVETEFCRRYGLTLTEVRECEEWLERLPAEPLILVHPVLDKIVAHDTASLDARPLCGY